MLDFKVDLEFANKIKVLKSGLLTFGYVNGGRKGEILHIIEGAGKSLLKNQ